MIKYSLINGISSKNLRELSLNGFEPDIIGILEQIIFSYPLVNRTIFKNITQKFESIDSSRNLLDGDDYLTDTIGTGIYSIKDFYDVLDTLVNDLASYSNTTGVSNILFTGGFDSRFILNSLNLSKRQSIECFTYSFGSSAEKFVASNFAFNANALFNTIELKPSWYTNYSVLNNHLGMVPLHSIALPNFLSEYFFIYGFSEFFHGFMGDPIFGEKSKISSSYTSTDEIIEDFFFSKYSRYSNAINFDISPYITDILHDIYLDYTRMDIVNSIADIDEVFFIKKRQLMIYKIFNCIDDKIKIETPFFDNSDLIKTALGISQELRIKKKAYLKYCELKFPKFNKNINSENPFGLNDFLSNLMKKSLNFVQYGLEFISPTISFSPFQHEHLKAQLYFNNEFYNNSLKDFYNLTGIIVDFNKATSRRNNSMDLPFSCASIASAFNK